MTKDDYLLSKFDEIENLAETNLEKALSEMIDIVEDASDSYHHDIVDRIVFWITTHGTHRTLEYLNNKINNTKDEYALEIFNEWIALLKTKTNK